MFHKEDLLDLKFFYACRSNKSIYKNTKKLKISNFFIKSPTNKLVDFTSKIEICFLNEKKTILEISHV